MFQREHLFDTPEQVSLVKFIDNLEYFWRAKITNVDEGEDAIIWKKDDKEFLAKLLCGQY